MLATDAFQMIFLVIEDDCIPFCECVYKFRIWASNQDRCGTSDVKSMLVREL